MKKIILCILFLYLGIFITFGNDTPSSSDYARGISAIEKNLNEARKTLNQGPPTTETTETIKRLEADLKTYQGLYQEAKKAEYNERKAKCAASGDCIDFPSFMIDTSLFSDGGKELKVKGNSQATINRALRTIIQKLMIALGVISLLIMTIGAGYIILYRGEDEYLSKGKSIFIAGILALIVSLSSYYIVNLIGYILYK